MPLATRRIIASLAWLFVATSSCEADGKGSDVHADDPGFEASAPSFGRRNDPPNATEPPFHRTSGPRLKFYQRGQVFVERAPDTDVIANYIVRLNHASFVETSNAVHRHGFVVVVVVDPGERSRIWFVAEPGMFGDPPPGLKQRLEAVPAPTVAHGPFVFALGAPFVYDRYAFPSKAPPIPDEWKLSVEDWEAAVATGQDQGLLDSVLRETSR